MRFDVHVHHHIAHDDKPPSWAVELRQLLAAVSTQVGQGNQRMSKIEDKLTELETAMTTIGQGVLGVKDDVEAQTLEIIALKEQIANGGLTPEAEARFDALIASSKDSAEKLAALDAQNPTTPTPVS